MRLTDEQVQELKEAIFGDEAFFCFDSADPFYMGS